jgi:hypothetical protein
VTTLRHLSRKARAIRRHATHADDVERVLRMYREAARVEQVLASQRVALRDPWALAQINIGG